jgi:hypothetical protein
MAKMPKALTHNQLFPDRLMTWMDCASGGIIASGSSAGKFGLGLNILTTPFNQNGGNSVWPSPQISDATVQPSGLKNILYNSGTNTGIYNFYRVWKVKVEVSILPQTSDDATTVCIAPVNSTGSYGTIETIQQGPNSKYKLVNLTEFRTLRATYDVPALMGVSKQDYGALSANTTGSFATTPSSYLFLQTTVQNAFYQNWSSNLGWNVRLKYMVEFLQRADVPLLDA